MERVYVNGEHSSALMKSMAKLWKDRKYCDAVLDVNSDTIELHKLILLAASPSIITKVNSITDRGTIVIKLEGKCYNKEAAKLCVQYLYKGIAKLTDSNVKAVTKIAEVLELKEILKICSSFRDTFKLYQESSESDLDYGSDTEEETEKYAEQVSENLTVALEEALDNIQQIEEQTDKKDPGLGTVKMEITSESCLVEAAKNRQTQKADDELETAIESIKDNEPVLKTQDALEPAYFYDALQNIDIDFFCGVPDSLLKDFCAYVTKNTPEENHVITANEGNAVGLAAGYHMATRRTALVYLQNSGLGNTVNPLLSLADPGVYSIPMLLLIGWRGEPGVKDEPQHVVQGKATEGLLNALGIQYTILPRNPEEITLALKVARGYMDQYSRPYALLVKKGTFCPYKLLKEESEFPLTRETAVKRIVDSLGPADVVVGTTGMLSRELYEYRVTLKQGHERDFLTVGSMGHASSISLGIALKQPERQVFCLDGDGAAIMHMGSQAIIGQQGPPNLRHIIINNGAHDSVGGQPTVARNHGNFSFRAIASGCGYKETLLATTEDEIKVAVERMRLRSEPCLLEVKVSKGARPDLGRPKTTPVENKLDFMNFLNEVM